MTDLTDPVERERLRAALNRNGALVYVPEITSAIILSALVLIDNLIAERYAVIHAMEVR